MNTFKEIATLKGHVDSVLNITFSPNGEYLASGSWDNTIRIWDMNTFKEIATLKGHANEVWDIAFSPNGEYLASGGNDKTIKIWDVDAKSKTFGKCVHTIKQQIDCRKMKILGAIGLNEKEIEFLVERGAIE